MSWKTKFFTFILFIGVNVSCYFWIDDCTGPEYDPSYFNIIGLEAGIYSDQWQRRFAEDTLMSSDLHVFFDFQMEFFSFFKPQQAQPFLSFGNSAYACSPLPRGSGGSKTERFEKISIITLFDFNEKYKAQDTITEIVDFSLGGIENPSPYYFGNNLDLEAFGPYPLLELANFSQTEVLKPFQVKLIVKLNTGEEYEAISPVVNIRQF